VSGVTALERQIIQELQYDLPIIPQPYAFIATKLGIAESALLAVINQMLQKGMIRRIGAVLRHRRIGFKANALCVWQVPLERVAEVGEMFAELMMVTHCYERSTHPQWPYNLYTMVHALTRQECQFQIEAMSARSQIDNFRIFYSTQELKKVSMHYFAPGDLI
jgi:DNA-binding Lrp family transcriptional regulator